MSDARSRASRNYEARIRQANAVRAKIAADLVGRFVNLFRHRKAAFPAQA